MHTVSPAAVIVSDSGSIVGTITSSGALRLQTETVVTASLPPGQNTIGRVELISGSSDIVGVIDDTEFADQQRLQVQSRITGTVDTNLVGVGDIVVTVSGTVQTSTAAVAANFLFRELLANTGSTNMVVDGSSTPVEFVVTSSATQDVKISELRILVTTDNTNMKESYFFEKEELPNGCLFEIRSEGTTTELANFRSTEDFLLLPSLNVFNVIDFTGLHDIFAVSYPLPGTVTLFSGSDDFVKMTIRDVLDDDHIKYIFNVVVFGEKV